MADPTERLARIEETLKHIDEKLDGVLARHESHERDINDVRARLAETRTSLAEIWAAIKVNRVFIGFALIGGGAGGASIIKLLQ